jgi:hypothetical protein
MQINRQEVETAVDRYLQVSAEALKTGDWDSWADLFTQDFTYVEHGYGTLNGRETFRAWIKDAMGKNMAQNPGMTLPVDWRVIDGNRVVLYQQITFPDPEGFDRRYQFPAVTILSYAGDGMFSYMEDLHDASEAMVVRTAVTEARNRVLGESTG